MLRVGTGSRTVLSRVAAATFFLTVFMSATLDGPLLGQETGPRPITPRGDLSGDIVMAVDGKPVESVARFLARLDDHQVGESVTVTVARDGRQRDVTATLQASGQ